jgi:hypothetical protein
MQEAISLWIRWNFKTGRPHFPSGRTLKPKQGDLGPMLWSQFSAIFDNFRQKIGVFLKKQCYGKIFAQFSFALSQKRQFFAEFFGENILKNHNIGPR